MGCRGKWKRLGSYLFWHLLFAVILGLVLYRLTAPNPPGRCLATVVLAGVLPDLDHLLVWDPKYISRLLPGYLWEGLTFAFRTAISDLILHVWLWPLLLLAVGLLVRKRKGHEYLFAAAAGWALHLVLDGVLVVI